MTSVGAAESPPELEQTEKRDRRDEREVENEVKIAGDGGSGEKSKEVEKDVDGENAKNGLDGEEVVEEVTEKEKEPSKVKKIIDKIGLDVPTVMMMFKASLPPIIGLAFYQSTAVADTYATLGYLIPIITVLSIAILPRAKFIQTMILNLLGICIGASVALLGLYSAVKAREHTETKYVKYNSSASAVCAIWLFANIWFVNLLRAKNPALQFPVMLYSIFTNVAFTYGPLFPTVKYGEQFIQQLLQGFLTAFAIATGVSLFIIPVSSRTVVFKEQAGYIALCQKTLKAQSAYLQSLETSDMFAPVASSENVEEDNKKKSKKSKKSESHPAHNTQAVALKECVTTLIALHGKLHGDLEFGKRETAWGKLDAEDIGEISTLLRAIMIPLLGMATITDIFERIAERRGWVQVPGSKFDEAESWEKSTEQDKEEEKRTWNEVMKALHEPFEICTTAMDEGLQHASLLLELTPKPKKKKTEDVEEAKSENPQPGDPEFKDYLTKRMKDFYAKRGETLKAWAREKGLSQEAFDAARPPQDNNNYTPDEAKHRRDQQQLYLILYLEHLLFSCGMAISNLVNYAEKNVADGKMGKSHLIFPGQRRIVKWIKNLGQEDVSVDTESPDSLEAGSTVYMGSGFNQKKKDPEHLPPTNWWQRFGNGLRSISHFLGSPESAFGFRVACATMTIGIVAYLEKTQNFFMEQRLVWAMIIIAIGMTQTLGQNLFGFIGRIAGTAISMVSAFVIWYIVDGKTAGVLVMAWLFIFIQFYFFLKFPRFIPIFIVSIVTEVLIIGYELQVRKIGIKASSASGQPYYPTYELAPYRLACVTGGTLVAFIWTIFPYPISDRSWIRKDLGTVLFLLANYYSVIDSTLKARMHETEGDMNLESSPGRKLEKARHKILGKLLLILPSLQQHADWQQWEINIGGKFPRETYEGISVRVVNIMRYLSLMSYATEPWGEAGSDFPQAIPSINNREWLNNFATLVDSVDSTTHAITSVLSLLSASVRQGSALPPYIQLPHPYNLSRRLEALDPGILSAKHVEEPGYSAYAVLQVCSSLVTDDLRRLVEHVKDLVGETDFSFRVDESATSVGSSMGSEGDGKGKKD